MEKVFLFILIHPHHVEYLNEACKNIGCTAEPAEWKGSMLRFRIVGTVEAIFKLGGALHVRGVV